MGAAVFSCLVVLGVKVEYIIANRAENNKEGDRLFNSFRNINSKAGICKRFWDGGL